jgi:lipopolysaccharide transport system permease protein
MQQPVAIRSGAGASIISLLNPASAVRNLASHWQLARQLAYRELVARYRTSWLGWTWSVLTPLALLVIYTFVFAVVFNTRWGKSPDEGKAEFALTMFCGMLVFSLFAEVINRAPSMIVDNPNYVKKVVFPLETLVVSGLLVALFNLLVGTVVWLVGWLLIKQAPPPITLLWLAIVLLPVCLTTVGLGWVLASLGVFVRDLSHAVVLGTQILFFATPIFYSLDRVPEFFRGWMMLNPLTHAVVNARKVMMYNELPDFVYLSISFAVSIALALLGYAFFMKSKRAFADVI